MAGTLDLARRCYTGLELRGDVLRLAPALPPGLPGLAMERRYRDHTSVRLRAGPDVPVSAMPPSALPPIRVALGDGPVSILAAGHTLWLRTSRTKE
jgi:hypothetical protein